MKILTSSQIRDWDKATTNTQDITPLELMERAANACSTWIREQYTPQTPFIVICGTGNNGGDGLAITRLLISAGYSALAFIVKHTDNLSQDCAANLIRLQRASPASVRELLPDEFISELPADVVVIDALLGTGLNRPVEGYVAAFINQINSLPNIKIAIDLPSGLAADEWLGPNATILKATHTLTLGQYKRTLLHPETGTFAGEVHKLDIGLDEVFTQSASSHWYTLEKADVQKIYKPREAFTHKGTYGTAFLIGGSHGLVGAILLASRAAGRAGAGKVRALIPECGYTVLQTAAPEAMCKTSGQNFIEAIEGWESSKGIGIGPGLGTEDLTVAALKSFLSACKQPIVLDADALTIIGAHPELLHLIPPGSILTPHPKELERLFGKSSDSFTRADQARQQAMAHDIIIVSKDRHTIIALPDGRCFYNLNGNSGLATGGSGDVLCGILTGLLAQGYSSADAAMLGVYLHAAAGDAAVPFTGKEALVAGDLVAHIGAAYLSLARP
jgi:hydroxyethylthiazole kinase-like uncharacterized protein yjeF